MSEPFIGEIIMFAGNFAPRGWQFCNGQILSIAQNTALFSILGTTYGGNGQTTFALPDLRGRAPVHAGMGAAGPGLSPVALGEVAGSLSTTLTILNLPAHNHVATFAPAAGSTPLAVSVAVANTPAPNSDPTAGILAQSQIPSRSAPTVVNSYAASTAATGALAGVSVSGTGQVTVAPAGGSQPFSNASPYLGINFIIATEGIFPSRN